MSNIITNRTKKRYKRFEQYVLDYTIKQLNKQGYTDLDLYEFELRLKNWYGLPTMIPGGTTIILINGKNYVTESIDFEWWELMKNKTMLHQQINRCITNLLSIEEE
jgi:hypothetical protein